MHKCLYHSNRRKFLFTQTHDISASPWGRVGFGTVLFSLSGFRLCTGVCHSHEKAVLLTYIYTFWPRDCFIFTFRFPSVHRCLSFTRKSCLLKYIYTFWPRDCFIFFFPVSGCAQVFVNHIREYFYWRIHIHIFALGLFYFCFPVSGCAHVYVTYTKKFITTIALFISNCVFREWGDSYTLIRA